MQSSATHYFHYCWRLYVAIYSLQITLHNAVYRLQRKRENFTFGPEQDREWSGIALGRRSGVFCIVWYLNTEMN